MLLDRKQGNKSRRAAAHRSPSDVGGKSASAPFSRNTKRGFLHTAIRPVALPDFYGAEVNYYYRYLGDYAKDTMHLNLLQTGAYTLLLDRYYATEAGIPADEVYDTCRAHTKPEREAVNKVLRRYFAKCGDTWVNGKCEKEILKARRRIEAARQNGAKHRPAGIPTGYPTGIPAGGSIQTLNPKPLNLPDFEAQKARDEELRGFLPSPNDDRHTSAQAARIARTKT